MALPLKFPPSSSQIYRLSHCFQIQSKNSPFLWCKHLWPLAISIRALVIRHYHVYICVLKLYYIMLGYVVGNRFCVSVSTALRCHPAEELLVE